MAYSADQPWHPRRLWKGHTLHELELPRVTAAHADVSRMTSLYDVVQGLHGLLDLPSQPGAWHSPATLWTDGRLVVESMTLDSSVFNHGYGVRRVPHLENIDIVDTEPVQRVLHAGEDALQSSALLASARGQDLPSWTASSC